MTLTSKLLGLFPPLHILLIVGAAAWFVVSPGVGTFVLIPFTIYLLPLLLWRVHNRLWPLVEGRTMLVGGAYNPWWGAYQLQWLFMSVPIVETLLRSTPGLFAWWLRAWGSKVGAGVTFTPDLLLFDRSMLEIGDGVVFGHGVAITSHLVNPMKGNLEIEIAKVRIHQRAFVGALVQLGPGVTVGEKASLGLRCLLGSHVTIGAGAKLGPTTQIDVKYSLAPGAVVDFGTRIKRDGTWLVP